MEVQSSPMTDPWDEGPVYHIYMFTTKNQQHQCIGKYLGGSGIYLGGITPILDDIAGKPSIFPGKCQLC